MKRALATIATVCAFCLFPSFAHAQKTPPRAAEKVLRVAAASDLEPVMPAFAAAFERETGVRLQVSFGSSNTLATQIVNGAPEDVFLSADFTAPEKVVAAGLATEKAPVPYARGILVLWARKDSPIQPLSMEKLSGPRVTRIAVADEFHAPYGRAAFAAMRWLKLYEPLKAKLVSAENVAQAAQFVESGNAQAGFLSLTTANAPHFQQIGSYVRVPTIYPAIRQCGIVLKRSPHVEEANRFLAWLTSPKVQEQLPHYGLEPAQ